MLNALKNKSCLSERDIPALILLFKRDVSAIIL